MTNNIQTNIDFSIFITDHTRDFTGREWVFCKINDWLQTNERIFLLTGGPGSGKSALAARLVQMSQGQAPTKDYPNLGKGNLTFYHFCQAFKDITLDPLRFVEALSQQLSNRYQPFAQAVLNAGSQEILINSTQNVETAASGVEIKNVVIESLHVGNLSPRIAFDRLVRRPLEQLCTENFKDTIFIMVDSLDEALTYDQDNNILTLLSDATDQPTDLPDNVRFLFTSRPDQRVLNTIGKASLDMIEDVPDNIDEVWDYAYRRLGVLSESRRKELTDRVADASKANFLYARYVLDNLLPNIDQVEDLSSLKLPKELDDIYREFLKRELGRNMERWEERYRPFLGVLAVARGDGLTREQLAGVTGLTQSKTDNILRACDQYLAGPKPDGPFHIYHKSFRDFFLTDDEYQVYPAEDNQTIAGFFTEEYVGNWLNCEEDYALQHTPTHLVEAMKHTTRRLTLQNLMDDLNGLLTDFNFLEAKTDWLGIDALLTDLRAALNELPSKDEAYADIQDILNVLNREAYNLHGWNRDLYPAFFAQQVLIQAIDIGLTHLMTIAEARLVQLEKPYLSPLWRNGWEKPIFTLIGHEDTVNAVAVTPDSHFAISASSDCTLKVWDLQTGQEVRTLRGHENSVNTVTVSTDGCQAISGSTDSTLKIWDLQTGQEVRTINLPISESSSHYAPKGVNAVAVTPDGRQAISASGDELKVLDLNTGKELHTLTGHDEEVQFVKITPDSCQAISASENYLKIWDLQTGKEVRTFEVDLNFCMCAITHDGCHAIFPNVFDKQILVLDLQTGKYEMYLMHILSGRYGPTMNVVAITPDGRHLICGSVDGVLKAWDLQTGQEICTLSSHSFEDNSVVITPDGHRFISTSGDEIKVWDLKIDTRPFTSHEGWVSAITVTPDGCHAISGSWDQTLKIWDLQTGQEMRTLTGHWDNVSAIAITPDGRHVISGSWDQTLKIWDLQTGKEILTLTGHQGFVSSVAITPDGQQIISGSHDGTLKVWDMQTRKEMHTFFSSWDTELDRYSPVYAVAITPDGKKVISGSRNGTLKVWDLHTRQEMRTLTGHKAFVSTVAITPDGQQVIFGDQNGRIIVWDLQTRQEILPFTKHREWVEALTITPDGRHAISGSGDRTLKVWDLKTGETIVTVALGEQIKSVAVAPDDITIVGDAAGNIYCLRYVNPKIKKAIRLFDKPAGDV